jgi:hypothetical protein
VSRLSNLFSDARFLKTSYHVVKFCKEKLRRSAKKESGTCDVFAIAIFQSIVPLFLWLLRCIHALESGDWCGCPKKLTRLKA